MLVYLQGDESCECLTDTSCILTNFYNQDKRLDMKRKTEPLEYFSYEFEVGSPTFVPQLHRLMAIWNCVAYT